MENNSDKIPSARSTMDIVRSRMALQLGRIDPEEYKQTAVYKHYEDAINDFRFTYKLIYGEPNKHLLYKHYSEEYQDIFPIDVYYCQLTCDW